MNKDKQNQQGEGRETHKINYIVVISAYKELSLSDAIATAVLYASLMSVAYSYWVLMNTANGLSGLGEEIE